MKGQTMAHRATHTVEPNSTRSVALNPGATVRVTVAGESSGRLVLQHDDGRKFGAIDLAAGDRLEFSTGAPRSASVTCIEGSIEVEEVH